MIFQHIERNLFSTNTGLKIDETASVQKIASFLFLKCQFLEQSSKFLKLNSQEGSIIFSYLILMFYGEIFLFQVSLCDRFQKENVCYRAFLDLI